MEFYSTWDNVNEGIDVNGRDMMGIRITTRPYAHHPPTGDLESTTDAYFITQQYWRDDWESMERYEEVTRLQKQLKALIKAGSLVPNSHVYFYVDGTHAVLKPNQPQLGETVMVNQDYLDRIANELRICVAAVSKSRDEYVESDMLQMIRMHSGNDAALLEPETVDAAKAKLDVFTGALVRMVDNFDDIACDAESLANYLESICLRATKYHATQMQDGAREITARYYHSYNRVYSIRAGEIMTKILKQVAEQTDSGYLLTLFSISSHYGAIYRAARSGNNGKTQRVINDLNILDYVDESDVEQLLFDNNYDHCSDCGDWEYDDNMRRPYDGSDTICPVCLENNYTWSDYYDEYIHSDNAREALDQHGDTVWISSDDHRFEWDDDQECYVHEDYSPPSRILRSYHSAKNRESYRLIPSPFTQVTGRYMGIELEVEVSDRGGRNRNDILEELNEQLNENNLGSNVWFEEDGSLSHGFEIISNPMGLDTHTEFWQWLNDDELVKGLRSHDTSTCGLHIHINKSALTTMQIDKMNVFINHPDNSSLIEKISRRYSTGYARINEKTLGKAHNSHERYEALNLTNRHTVELRIFKGTLKYTSLMAALEFANALVNFTAPASPAGFRLDTRTFMKFLELPAHRNETKFLRNYLEARSPQTL